MIERFTVRCDSNDLKLFRVALALNNETMQDAVSRMIRDYADRAGALAAVSAAADKIGSKK